MEQNHTIITGGLEQISLFDLVNFLKSTNKTGILTLVKEDLRGYFYFRQGQIVNVMNESLAQGEHLAIKYFRWQNGNFEFSQADVPEVTRIKKDTDSLLFDIARSLDEESKKPADANKQDAAETKEEEDDISKLRDVFSTALKHSRDGNARSRQIDIHDVIKTLRDNNAHDITVRAGRPLLVRKRDDTLVAVGLPISSLDVVRLLDQIMAKENHPFLHERGYFRQRKFETASGDLEFLLVRDLQGYTITMRLIEKEVPTIEDVGLEEAEKLQDFVAEPGILLISGARPDLRSNLFAALVDWLNKKYDTHMLLITERHHWSYEDKKSLVTQLLAEEDADANVIKLRTLLSNAPRFLAYDAPFSSKILDILLDFCQEGGTVLLTVRGGDVEALATQVSQATGEKSAREMLIRTRALIYADNSGSAHIKPMSYDGTTKLTRTIRKQPEQSPSSR
jgi:hypothetical protein